LSVYLSVCLPIGLSVDLASKKCDIKFNLQISQQPQPWPSSGKRPCFIPYLEPREFLMETEDSDSTESEIKKNIEKKLEQYDNKEELSIDSEKSKVNLTIFMTTLQK
jgi:hypothetical protein